MLLLEHELVGAVVADRGGRGERPCVQRIAEGEVVLLDRDDVREIRSHVEREF